MCKFVPTPLCEIEPELIHPFYNKNIKLLLSECTDTSFIEIINENNALNEPPKTEQIIVYF